MSKRNPTVATHPDLFESQQTPVVKSLDEMTEEEIVTLPRSAFSDDEWDELDEDLQLSIRENDKESRNRVEELIEHFVGLHKAITEPDERWISDRVEEEFDMYFSEMGDEAVDFILKTRGRGRDSLRDLIDEWKEEGYAEEQVVAALNTILQDRDNWTFDYDTSEYGSAFFKAVSSDSFYVEKQELADWIEGMYPDEIEEALDEINSKTNLSLDLADIEKAVEKWGLDINDYITFYADADPDWGKISAELKRALEDEEPEGEPEDIEDRIIYRFKDGGYVVDLLASELPAEGRNRGLCVGSRNYGYMQAVEEGKNKIFSMRDAEGKREYTMQALMRPDGTLNYIGQIKREHNNLPRVEDVPKLIEFLQEGLGLPRRKWKDIQDLKPALRAAGLIKSLPAPQENPEEDAHCGFCCPANQP